VLIDDSADRESEDEAGLLQVVSTSVAHKTHPYAAATTAQWYHRAMDKTHPLAAAEAAAAAVQKRSTEATCAPLTNHVSFASVAVGIGTPAQTFDLVVDTGSDDILVADCNCDSRGKCDLSEQCFDYGSSSTAGAVLVSDKDGNVGLARADLTYGSGTLVTVVGSDVVTVAGTVANMTGGIFVIEDESQLRIGGEFEGIFPLGVPLPKYYGDMPLWADVAKVPRYTLCLSKPGGENGGGNFVVNTDTFPEPFEQIGTQHWGLGLEGISAGDLSAPVAICDPATKVDGQDTACGFIPDSGTTLIMGPALQILALQNAICDAWPRCSERVKNDGYLSKLNAFNDLLYKCGEWLTEEEGINEIPPITLHLTGKDGKPRKHQLVAWTYIFETEAEMYLQITGKLFGELDVNLKIPTGQTVKTCTAGFGPLEWSTFQNGPVWIFGTSLFYDYTVGFDISTKPYLISLSDAPCTKCEDGQDQASLLQGPFGNFSTQLTHQRADSRKKALRFLRGPPRERRWNTSMPL
jgi:hypothetical protein